MPFGNINQRMRTALSTIVKGRVIHDLGAGDGDHARTLILCGATKVIAIDKEPIPRPRVPSIECIQARIVEVPVPEDLDVVFLGWPVNYNIPGLAPWLSQAKTIIYLGSNFGGTACGNPHLFEVLLRRRLSLHIPDRRNSLLVVEEPLQEPRRPTTEEAAAFSSEALPYPGP